jgi:hypothetical protein
MKESLYPTRSNWERQGEKEKRKKKVKKGKRGRRRGGDGGRERRSGRVREARRGGIKARRCVAGEGVGRDTHAYLLALHIASLGPHVGKLVHLSSVLLHYLFYLVQVHVCVRHIPTLVLLFAPH